MAQSAVSYTTDQSALAFIRLTNRSTPDFNSALRWEERSRTEVSDVPRLRNGDNRGATAWLKQKIAPSLVKVRVITENILQNCLAL